jgi:diacylglycerol kinase (ATP)
MPAGLLDSFGHALRGLVEVTARERNMKIHVLAGIAVGVVGGEVALPYAGRLALLLAVALVISAEMLNSALEALVDLHTRERREEARRVKDAAAGAVLVLAVGAVLLAAAVVAGSWEMVQASLPRLWSHGAGVVAVLLLAAGQLAPGRRHPALDLVGALVGLAILAVLAASTRSAAFTVTAVALFALAAASARHRRGAPA